MEIRPDLIQTGVARQTVETGARLEVEQHTPCSIGDETYSSYAPECGRLRAPTMDASRSRGGVATGDRTETRRILRFWWLKAIQRAPSPFKRRSLTGNSGTPFSVDLRNEANNKYSCFQTG